MPGERVDDAFAAATRLQDEGIGVLFTHLGENLDSLAEADDVAAHYRDVIERDVRRAHRTAESRSRSSRPSSGSTRAARPASRTASTLAALAHERGTWFWLDMEGSAYTEATIALYERLRERHDRVGIAIQAYLRRTAADIARLLPLRPAIRLVKGAYDEPAEIAYRDRAAVDANYQALAALIAEAAGRGEARLALGTHDTELIERITTVAEAGGAPRSALEVHMLYGIRTDELRRLRDAGHPAFSLIAYGEAWYAWYMRRLAERPANVVFALRQLLP